MIGEKIVKTCEEVGLKLGLDKNGNITIDGEAKVVERVRRKLAKNEGLNAEVMAILRAKAAIEEERPQTQEQQLTLEEEQAQQTEAECESGGLELDGVTACIKALRGLAEGQKSKLKGFIAACQRRGLKLIADSKRRVYLERVDGEPITGDISDLFTWIFGFSECALLVFIGTQDSDIADELNDTAIRVNTDLFTAAALMMELKRDLYIDSCADWNFKPRNLPPKQEPKSDTDTSDTTLRIFEVENQRGERFKFQVSCIDEALPDALIGLRVISEYDFNAGQFRPPDASLITGDKTD
ncbi:MAG: hypothetical protein II948_07225 [Synergistaceae bacterium]|nr:hypothetical protein [Synergistaceae bacterium]MBQ4419566.1 hypothetical protein [Synergistaceae bacterium]MBR0221820.1 hypothetical protein [Synergistaceae bacterium]